MSSMSSIHRLLEEIRDIEEAKTALVDELDRHTRARYAHLDICEGEVWEVTLTDEDADNSAHNIPAIRTKSGWLTDPKWGKYSDDDSYGTSWEDEHVYPHNRLT